MSFPREPSVSVRLLWAFARLAGSSGFSGTRISADSCRLDNPTARVPRWLATQMLEVAAALDPAIGLRAVDAMDASDFDVVEYAARAAPTVGEAAACFSRYFSLIDDGTELGVRHDGDSFVILSRVRPGLRQPPAANDFAIAVTLAFSRRNALDYEPPIEIHLAHEEPPYASEYGRAFGAPVRFGKEHNAIVIPSHRARTPMLHANEPLFRALSAHAAQLVQEVEASDGFSGRVRRRLLSHLGSGQLEMEETARSEGMAVATLRRRLQEEGTTFAAIVDGVRQDLALRYLRDDGPVKDVALRLGYREINSFSRAFRRWTGMTPGTYRALSTKTVAVRRAG